MYRTLLPVFIAITCIGCEKSQNQQIPDVSKPQRIVFLDSNKEPPSGVSLAIHGHIDGIATISGDNWDKVTISGDVDYNVYHDWFYSSCAVTYSPRNVHSGALTINATFH
jgi:hypothetical protein